VLDVKIRRRPLPQLRFARLGRRWTASSDVGIFYTTWSALRKSYLFMVIGDVGAEPAAVVGPHRCGAQGKAGPSRAHQGEAAGS